MQRLFVLFIFFLLLIPFAYSQTDTTGTEKPAIDSVRIEKQILDSLFIEEVQSDKKGRDKVLHAEPLYIDLIRDLGARKGEREWNFGFGMADHLNYDAYEMLVEYEWAPVDRLGLEIEVPVLLIAGKRNGDNGTTPRPEIPSSRVESIKTAMQWSFYVSERHKTSLALGYINELEFSDLKSFGNPLFKGNLYNPFFIAAKRFGNNYHTLLYTGPRIAQSFTRAPLQLGYEMHSNFHYMITGTRNFIGLEINKYIHEGALDVVFRPQMRLSIADNFLIGIVTGIPVSRKDERFSSFMRIIWEPEHKSHLHRPRPRRR